MSANDRVLLDNFLESQKSEWSIHLSDAHAFELLVCAQILKDYHLSLDEVASGIVGGGGDGGVDGVYTFVDDQLLAEDSDIFDGSVSPSSFRKNVQLALLIVQAKRGESFSETAVDLVSDSTRRLLDLERTESQLSSLYSADLVEKVGLFRRALQQLATRFPGIRIEFTYATRGDTRHINSKVEQKGRDLRDQFANTVNGATAKVDFLGANELWQIISQTPSYTLQLSYQENATNGNSHVALVTLRDYKAFLTGEDRRLRRHIFDWNVRDYQGNVEVNKEIRSSLGDPDAPDFWWLNNGVTIISSKVSSQGKTYTLDDVQIVNGLQTSYTIFDALLNVEERNAVLDRILLVRILETKDFATRDRVIRATNKQTTVPEASLRATDDIQRKIESFFLSKNWYYERRKNYYRNLGKPKDRLVSIPFLAQTVMAIGLSRPNDARARPTSLLKTDDNYRTVFADSIPLSVYLWTIKAQREANAFLQSNMEDASEGTNLRFHLSMLATARLFGGKVNKPEQLWALADDDRKLAEADLLACLTTLRNYHAWARGGDGRIARQDRERANIRRKDLERRSIIFRSRLRGSIRSLSPRSKAENPRVFGWLPEGSRWGLNLGGMVRTKEVAFNALLAEELITRHPRWTSRLVTAEATDVLVGTPAKSPDIVVGYPGESSVIVETEFEPANTVEEDARERLGGHYQGHW